MLSCQRWKTGRGGGEKRREEKGEKEKNGREKKEEEKKKKKKIGDKSLFESDTCTRVRRNGDDILTEEEDAPVFCRLLLPFAAALANLFFIFLL